MSKIKILHLSDVHFGHADIDGEQTGILNGIIKALDSDGNSDIDYIIFTGDLAFSGSPTQFQFGFDWLKSIAEKTNSKIIICPGNHDLDRKLAICDELRLASPNKNTFNTQKKKIYQNHPHIRPFLNWFKTIKNNNNRLFLNNWGNNAMIDNVSDICGDSLVKFCCINTALLSCDKNDIGQLAVDMQAVNSFLGKCDQDLDLVIVIGHHPIDNWLVNWNSEELKKALGRSNNGAHVYMHGHLHEKAGEGSFNIQGKSLCILSAGAAYQGSSWEQAFITWEFNFPSNKIQPEVFKYSDTSGLWHKSEADSRPITLTLPTPPTKPIISAISEQSGIETFQSFETNNQEKRISIEGLKKIKWDNPFSHTVANDMDPADITSLFVDNNNYLNQISDQFDTIIEGQRGTGKTMLLRYMSIEAQKQLLIESGSSIENFVKEQKNYFGVYSRLMKAGFDRTDYDSVEFKERKISLFNHRLTIFLISRFFESIMTFVEQNRSLNDVEIRIVTKIESLLRINGKMNNVSSWADLKFLIDLYCDERLQEIDEHVASLLPGGNNLVFNPWLSVSTSFFSLLKLVKNILGIRCPFYLLLDDFDCLADYQQQAIFTVAAERNHSLVCFKYGIMSYGLKTNLSGVDRLYKSGDDYNYIELNWLDKGLISGRAGSNYKNSVIEIAERRIKASNWSNDIKYYNLFNSWEHGNKIREEVKRLAKAHYESFPVNNRPHTFESFWTKQGNAYFLRHLKSKKIENRYAGPDTIISISSGIYRQFLEICSRIVTTALDSKWEPSSPKIGPEIQNSAIRTYSNDMLKSIGEVGGFSSFDAPDNITITSKHLENLANGLSEFFAEKLYDTGTKDPEVIAIAIKGDFEKDPFSKALLRIAVKESILQKRGIDYSAKSGGTKRLPTYVLNRRLAPRYSLPTKLQGRHELEIQDIKLLATDPALFVRNKSKKPK